MIAYITSIGEKTTDICVEQLKRLGFDTILLKDKEDWDIKYRRFITEAKEDCLRLDADIIVNKNIVQEIEKYKDKNYLMVQFKGLDFYRNNIGIIGVLFYKKEAIEIIRNNLDKISITRPEATAWRLPEMENRRHTSDTVVGIHGFFQTEDDIKRHQQNKIERKQIKNYDFELAERLLNLK